MKKYIRRWIGVLALALILAGGAVTVQAAAAKTVKCEQKYNSSGKNWAVFKGLTKSGKVVWTYKTPKREAAQLVYSGYTVTKKYVYIVDNNKFIKLKLKNGKKVLSKKLSKKIGGSPAVLADQSGNFYVVGYLGTRVLKYNTKGKKLWVSPDLEKKTGLIWFYDLKLSGNTLTVYSEGQSEYYYSHEDEYYVNLNTKTGKIDSYSNPG